MTSSKENRDRMDHAVLEAVCGRPGHVTCVYRDRLAMKGVEPGGGKWETAAVLRSLRRLERRGLVQKARTSYRVMLAWEPTDAGLHCFAEGHQGSARYQLHQTSKR